MKVYPTEGSLQDKVNHPGEISEEEEEIKKKLLASSITGHSGTGSQLPRRPWVPGSS